MATVVDHGGLLLVPANITARFSMTLQEVAVGLQVASVRFRWSVVLWRFTATPDPREVTMNKKSWRCRLGLHRFVVMWNEDNQRYMRCRRCGRDHPGSSSGPLDRFTDIGGGG